MKVVNINEAKAKLSEFLEAVAEGETVIICNRNQPVAELKAIPKKRTEPRPVGGAEGTITILPSFYDPLPDEELDAFYNSQLLPELPRSDRGAERARPYRSRRRTPRRR